MDAKIKYLLLLVLCIVVTARAQTFQLDLTGVLGAKSSSTNQNSSTLNLLDGDNATTWRSVDGEYYVNLTLIPNMANAINAYSIFTVTLGFREGFLPEMVIFYTNDFKTPASAIAADCNLVPDSPCSLYAQKNDTVVFTMTVPEGTDVNSLDFMLIGFPGDSQSFEIHSAQVEGYLRLGFYLPGPLYAKAEGEHGNMINEDEKIYSLSDRSIFSEFSGRGFANFSYGTEDVKIQWNIEIKQSTPIENLIIRYRNNQIQSYWFQMDAMSHGTMCELRFIINNTHLETCEDNCFSRVDYLNGCSLDAFEPGDLTLIGQLGYANFALDYIAAIPEAYSNDESFVNECDVFDSSISSYTESCVQQALQLSLEVDPVPKMCDCNSDNSNLSVPCAQLGGQCSCLEGIGNLTDHLGRQCSKCPFRYYSIVGEGCAPCNCPDNYDCGCDTCNGQCKCKDGNKGRRCNVCKDGYYGDPLSEDGCEECSCNSIGAVQPCNNVTGNCTCKDNIVGVTCSECKTGFYNFSVNGCQDCDCNIQGSKDIQCNLTSGICSCKDGYTGEKCTECLEGYFKFDNSCHPCDCSNRTQNCSQNPNILDTYSEVCTCPFGYEGHSCESCIDGYYLADTNECEACNCTELCNKTTGECFAFPPPPPPTSPPPPDPPLNCTPNTTGDFCEMCAEGYYNSAPNLDLICDPCPCNTNTSTNTSCYVDNSQPICYCLPGHESPLCDSCSSGHYGMPPEYPCSTCECSGNIEPSDPDACNKTTGVCIKCLYNTTGPNCGECANGFYGNANMKDCKPCDCTKDGVDDNNICDSANGVCNCLSGVNGDSCSQCKDGYWDFQSRNGCRACECDSIGSYNNSCDVMNGECPCKPGVTGQHCDTCMEEFFGLTDSGCTACNCSSFGAFNNSCNSSSGQCSCAGGSVGRQCEMCLPLHQLNEGTLGCQPCDTCVTSLIETNTAINQTLNETEALTKKATELRGADTLNLTDIQLKVKEIKLLYNNTAEDLVNASEELEGLQEKGTDLKEKFAKLETQISYIKGNATAGLPFADSVLETITNLYNEMESDFIGAGATLIFLKSVKSSMENLVDEASAIFSEVTSIGNSLLSESFSDRLDNSTDKAKQVFDHNDTITALYKKSLTESEAILTLQDNTMKLDAEFNDLYHNFTWLVSHLTAVQKDITMTRWTAGNFTSDVADINSQIKSATDLIYLYKGVMDQARESLWDTKSKIQTISRLLTNSFDSSGSGDVKVQESSPLEVLGELDLEVTLLVNNFNSSLNNFNSAIAYGNSVCTASQNIESILQSSLTAGNKAVNAIIDYTAVKNLLLEASVIARSANETLEGVLESVANLMVSGIEEDVANLTSFLKALTEEWKLLNSQIQLLMARYERELKKLEVTKVAVDTTTTSVKELTEDVNSFISNTSSSLPSVLSQLSTISETVEQANNTYNTVRDKTHPQLLSDAASVAELIESVTQYTNEAQNVIEEANKTSVEALDELKERRGFLDEIETLSVRMQSNLSQAHADLDSLLQKLEEAEEAAASIDVALRFQGNNSASYNISQPATDSSYVSLYFRGDVLSGTLLSSYGVSLSLTNGKLEWRDGETVITASGVLLFENIWYQVYASSMGESRYLSLAPVTVSGNSFTVVEDVGSPPSGIGSTVTIATNTNKNWYFSGCVDRVIINGEMLSLLSTTDSVSTCGPRPPAEMAFEVEPGSWCQGGGSSVTFSSYDFSSGDFSLDMYIRTFSKSSDVFRAKNSGQTLSLIISNGMPMLDIIALGNIAFNTLSSMVLINDGVWHRITVTIDYPIVFLNVDNNVESVTLDQSFSKPLDSPIDIYIGGYEESSYHSFAGCMRNVSINNETLDFDSATTSERVETSGCPAKAIAGTRFMGYGAAVFPGFNTMTFLTSVSFSFRTGQIASVLLHVSTETLPDELIISLYQTYIRVDFKNSLMNSSSFLSEQRDLNDMKWHSVTFRTSLDSLILVVDDEQVTYSGFDDLSGQLMLDEKGTIVVGGLSPQSSTLVAAVSESFRGCMKDLEINEMSQDFNEAELNGVALYGCRGDIMPSPSPSPSSSVHVSSTSFSSFSPTPTSVDIGSGSDDSDSTLQPSSVMTSTTPPTPSTASLSSLSISESMNMSTTGTSTLFTSSTSTTSPTPSTTSLPSLSISESMNMSATGTSTLFTSSNSTTSPTPSTTSLQSLSISESMNMSTTHGTFTLFTSPTLTTPPTPSTASLSSLSISESMNMSTTGTSTLFTSSTSTTPSTPSTASLSSLSTSESMNMSATGTSTRFTSSTSATSPTPFTTSLQSLSISESMNMSTTGTSTLFTSPTLTTPPTPPTASLSSLSTSESMNMSVTGTSTLFTSSTSATPPTPSTASLSSLSISESMNMSTTGTSTLFTSPTLTTPPTPSTASLSSLSTFESMNMSTTGTSTLFTSSTSTTPPTPSTASLSSLSTSESMNMSTTGTSTLFISPTSTTPPTPSTASLSSLSISESMNMSTTGTSTLFTSPTLTTPPTPSTASLSSLSTSESMNMSTTGTSTLFTSSTSTTPPTPSTASLSSLSTSESMNMSTTGTSTLFISPTLTTPSTPSTASLSSLSTSESMNMSTTGTSTLFTSSTSTTPPTPSTASLSSLSISESMTGSTTSTVSMLPTSSLTSPMTTMSVSTLSSSSSVSISPIPSSTPIMSVGLDGYENSFLSYSISPKDIASSNDISLVFRTASSHAVLLFIHGSKDFLALEMRNGKLYYLYDLGAGQSFAISTEDYQTRYDDDILHNVTLTRSGRSGSLIVDGLRVDGMSPPGYTMLNLGNNLLYVGGVSENVSLDSLADNNEQVPPSALACFESLTITSVSVDLSHPLAASGMVECAAHLNDHVSFLGGGFAIIESDYNPLREFGFQLEFRTLNCSGLLLYASSNYNQDHTALELYNGNVRFLFDNGGGSPALVILVYEPSDPRELCDGAWHSIVVTKSDIEGSLTVDDNTPVSGTSAVTDHVAVNIDTPLYAGGVPDSVIPRYTVLSDQGFNGCLKNVKLTSAGGTEKHIHFSQADLSSPAEVKLNTCHI